MDYGRIITQAWNLTWRYRFLWLLGFFAGGGTYSCSSGTGWNFGSSSSQGAAPPNVQHQMEVASAWLQANWALIVALVGVLILLTLVYFVVSFIAQGGIVRAGADLAHGIPCSPGDAWRYGLRFAWRYVGLFFLLVLIWIAIAVFIGIVAGILVAIGAFLGTAGKVIALALGVVFAFVGVLALIAFAIGLGITVTYAKRAISVEDRGVFDSLRRGMTILQTRLGQSLLVWLIGVGLGIAAAIVVTIIVVVVLVPLVLLGIAVYAVGAGFTAGFAVYAVLAFLVFLAVSFVLSAIVNTFFWNYWTVAFLGLTEPVEPTA